MFLEDSMSTYSPAVIKFSKVSLVTWRCFICYRRIPLKDIQSDGQMGDREEKKEKREKRERQDSNENSSDFFDLNLQLLMLFDAAVTNHG